MFALGALSLLLCQALQEGQHKENLDKQFTPPVIPSRLVKSMVLIKRVLARQIEGDNEFLAPPHTF